MEAGQVDLVIVGRMTGIHLLLTLLLPIALIPTASFTEVTYVCFLRGEDKLHLECPPSSRVKIIESKHGRNKWGTCVLLQGSSDRNECTQRSPVAEQCCGTESCNVTVKAVFIPSCGYSSGFIRVIHECVKDTNVTCNTNQPGVLGSDKPTSIPSSTNPSTTNIVSSTKTTSKIPKVYSTAGSSAYSLNTTIDPIWFAKVKNNTEWTGERHIVVKAKPPDASQSKGDADLQAVWACLAISLIIVGSLVTVLIYIWRKKKLEDVESGTAEPPDNNNHMVSELQDVSSFKTKTNSAPNPATTTSAGSPAKPGVTNLSFQTSPEPRIIRTASRRRYSSMREFQTGEFPVLTLPQPEDSETAPSRLNRTLSMTSFVLSDTLTRKRKNRDGDFQLVIKPNVESEPV